MPNREDQETTLSQRKTQIKTETSNSSARHDEYVRNERPLIDQVSNKWREGKHPNASKEEIEEGFGICDLEDESSCPNLTRSAILSRRFRRMLFLLLLLAAAAFCLWQWYLRPRLEEEWDYKEGFLLRGNGTFGIAKGGDFDGVRVHELDSRLLPGGKHDPDGKRRLVFVGDIHGCAHELKKLLKEVEFDEETDHLITVGDVISKGPENVEVLEELIRLKASNVRGNHEDRILALVHSTLESTFEPSSAEFSTEKLQKGRSTFATALAASSRISPDHAAHDYGSRLSRLLLNPLTRNILQLRKRSWSSTQDWCLLFRWKSRIHTS